MRDVGQDQETGRQIDPETASEEKSDPEVAIESDVLRVARKRMTEPPAAVEKRPPSHPQKSLTRKIKRTAINFDFEMYCNQYVYEKFNKI